MLEDLAELGNPPPDEPKRRPILRRITPAERLLQELGITEPREIDLEARLSTSARAFAMPAGRLRGENNRTQRRGHHHDRRGLHAVAQALLARLAPLQIPWRHKSIEGSELVIGVEREYVSDILVGANNDDAALISVDAPQVEDVLAQPAVGAEHLFVVVQPVASLAGQEQGGHGRQVEIAVALLEDGTEIDNGIDVYIRRGEAADRRAWRGGKEGAEGMKAG